MDQELEYFPQHTRRGTMSQRRRVCFILAVFLLLVSQAVAWEFSMTGNFTWEFYQFSQLGDKGFFGPFNQDKSSVGGTVNLAARNGWLGHEITYNANDKDHTGSTGLASGSDVAANYLYTIFYPRVRVNPALALQGSYRIGGWVDPSQDVSLGQLTASRYLNSEAPGIERSFSPGYWQLWYATALFPWGEVTIGKAPNTIGLGLIIDTSENTAEAVTIAVPFGPLILGTLYYPWARGTSSNYPLLTDRNAQSQPHVAGFVLYWTGNINCNTYLEYLNGHQGPESKPMTPDANSFLPLDYTLFYGFSDIKYSNGQFFFNAEVAFHQDFYKESRSATNGGSPRTRYWELWTGMIESGVMAGPAKISFFWAYSPGCDRRGGLLIDRQPSLPGSLLDAGVNIYRPYSLLLGYNYGSGNNSIAGNSQDGYITDASTYGVRFDYAVAANLNAYATLLYARRVSQGYGWGWIRPDPRGSLASPSTFPALQYGLQGSLRMATNYSFPSVDGTLVPNILERDLGYEIGGGIDWKLIEGYTLRARIAYWKPGDWFKFACVDRTQPGWDNPSAANRWGINPNREIDPIFGMRVAIQAEF